jgi:hypothetical protein
MRLPLPNDDGPFMLITKRFIAQYRARRMLAEQTRWRSFWGALLDLLGL